MNTKKCNKCNIKKEITEFYKGRNSCKICKCKYERQYALKNQNIIRENKKKYREKYKEILIQKKKIWYQDNIEQVAQSHKIWYIKNIDKKKEYETVYQKENKDKITIYRKKYLKEKMANDLNFKLKKNLRNRLTIALKNNQKTGSAVKDLGCSIEELKNHLENLFQEGMSWDNRSEWHIDHIKPLASFDLNNRVELLKACHYTNLQPLWAKDNLIKGAKYE